MFTEKFGQHRLAASARILLSRDNRIRLACLADLRLCARGRAAELVEANVKPLVDGLQGFSWNKETVTGSRTACKLHCSHFSGSPSQLMRALPCFCDCRMVLINPTLWMAWYLSQICWQVSPSSSA